MKLLRVPQKPKASIHYVFSQHLESQNEWLKFIPEWEKSW